MVECGQATQTHQPERLPPVPKMQTVPRNYGARPVLRCSRLSPETQVFRQTLKDAMGSITPDTITNMLFRVLRQLSVEPGNSPRLVISPTLPPKVRTALRQAIREQAVIGWPLLLRGYLARSWTVAYT
jgi:hypothetical protein